MRDLLKKYEHEGKIYYFESSVFRNSVKEKIKMFNEKGVKITKKKIMEDIVEATCSSVETVKH